MWGAHGISPLSDDDDDDSLPPLVQAVRPEDHSTDCSSQEYSAGLDAVAADGGSETDANDKALSPLLPPRGPRAPNVAIEETSSRSTSTNSSLPPLLQRADRGHDNDSSSGSESNITNLAAPANESDDYSGNNDIALDTAVDNLDFSSVLDFLRHNINILNFTLAGLDMSVPDIPNVGGPRLQELTRFAIEHYSEMQIKLHLTLSKHRGDLQRKSLIDFLVDCKLNKADLAGIYATIALVQELVMLEAKKPGVAGEDSATETIFPASLSSSSSAAAATRTRLLVPDPLPDMPGLMPIEEPGSHGVWTLESSSSSSSSQAEVTRRFMLSYTYVSCQNQEGRLCQTESHGHVLSAATMQAFLIPAANDCRSSVWVCSREDDDSTEKVKWYIYHRSELGVGKVLYTVEQHFSSNQPVVVPNGFKDAWVMVATKQGGAKSSSTVVFKLLLYSARHRAGQEIVANLPPAVRLVGHSSSGGVFLHVPLSSLDNKPLSVTTSLGVGLWYISRWGERTHLSSMVGADWFMAHDANRDGIWVLGPADRSVHGVLRSRLVHVSSSGEEVKEQAVDVDFNFVKDIFDDRGVGLLLHHKDGDRWKLSKAKIGRRFVVPLHDCPRANRVVADGIGGAWILKRVGRNAAERVLMHVEEDSSTIECERRFSNSCSMASSTSADM
jgi:hypothetical protein